MSGDDVSNQAYHNPVAEDDVRVQAQGSTMSEDDVKVQAHGGAMSEDDAKKQAHGGAMSENDVKKQAHGGAMSENDVKKQAHGSTISEEEMKAKLRAKEAEAKAQMKGSTESVTVDLSKYLQTHDEGGGVRSFAINPHERNTSQNPDHESTFTMPTLVRRVNSEELLPRPFKSTTQLLVTSYLCIFCFIVFAVYAVQHAWEAKQKRNAGVYTSAIREGKRACRCIKLALAFGVCCWILGIVLITLHFTGVTDN